MKTKQSFVNVALLSSLTLAAGLALAGTPDYPTNPERSYIDQTPPTEKTAAEVRADVEEILSMSAAAGGWQDVGGEHGDKFVGGKFDEIDSPSQAWADDHMMASLYFRNTY